MRSIRVVGDLRDSEEDMNRGLLRTLRNAFLALLRAPNFVAIPHRRHTVESSRCGWFPPRGHSSRTASHVHALPVVDPLLGVFAGVLRGEKKVETGAVTVWEWGGWGS